MPNLYCVSIRWVKTALSPTSIENVLGRNGDWLRFDGYTWLAHSNANAHDLTNQLRAVLNVEDNILVFKCDLSDYSGWAQKWVWDWITAKYPVSALSGLPSAHGSSGLSALSSLKDLPPRK
jgi:hypothetical protein